MNFLYLSAQIQSLVIFRAIAQAPVLEKLNGFLHAADLPLDEQVKRYADFVAELYRYGYDFGQYLLEAAATDENAYVKLCAAGKPIPPALGACMDGELSVLAGLSRLTSASLCAAMDYPGYLPQFESAPFDFAAAYKRRLADISRNGYGVYARHTMFCVRAEEIVPVLSADKTSLDSLIGYQRERQQVMDNTYSLLRGLPAANVLLCGDAGTGKSTTVKAIANHFAPDGLRLVELHKEQLRSIPSVMEKLRENPLKFILFIDDLSFQKNDDNLSALKAILEGSAAVRASNVVIYATSNRRHLVRETFSDREGDEVHRGDTMQELLSLSERFGLSITFSRPDKTLYLEIVHRLAEKKKIQLCETELDRRAEAFALRKGGRTARAAEQFTDSLMSAHSPT